MAKERFSLKAVISLALSIMLVGSQMGTAFAASNNDLKAKKDEVKSESVFKDNEKEILKVTKNGKTVYATKKSVLIDINKVKYNEINDNEFRNSLSKDLKDELKSTKSVKFGLVQRTYFGISDSLAEAKKVADDINIAANEAVKAGELQAQAQSTFWHGSYIEDYSSWAGHGYHVHLASTDVSYITNLGWVAADGIAGALVALEVVSGPVGVVIGAIATVAVLTLSWAESNSDGSLDIWSPDALRGTPSAITHGATLGTVKIGSHWYPLIR